MVHWWQDPAVEARLAVLYVNMIFFLLGAYGWEYFMSFGIEYAIIRRRLPFRWPLVPYLAGRISLLIVLLLLAIGMSQTPFDCQCGATSTALSGTIAIGSSSTNLMIRTWVIWKNSRLVHMLLLLAALGHWTILLLDVVNIRSYRSNGACVIYLTHPAVSAGVFVYTMCYDFLVLILSIMKLSKQPSNSTLKERLRAQGLLYFAVAAIAYIPPTVFALFGSTPMVGITGSSAMTASTIASCRAVRSLLVLRMPHPSDAPHAGVERNVVLTTQFSDQASSAFMGTQC